MNHHTTYGEKQNTGKRRVALKNLYRIESSDKFCIHMRISRDMWNMRAHFGFVVVYLLGEGYVIPVCVRVI